MATPDFSKGYFQAFHNNFGQTDYTYTITFNTVNPAANEGWEAEMTSKRNLALFWNF